MVVKINKKKGFKYVWERLSDVDGNTIYVDDLFRTPEEKES
jgi:hypothetical protein